MKLERLFPAQLSFGPRLDRFQTLCLPNNLPGEESDQARQKTRLTVPDCAVREIRSLRERSYSTSWSTDERKVVARRNKDRWGRRRRKKKRA